MAMGLYYPHTSGTTTTYHTYTNTSTTTTATGAWTNVYPSPPEPRREPPRPLRIAQRRKALTIPCPDGMVPQTVEVHTIEIPAHRVPTLQWYTIDSNSLLELPDGTLIDVEDPYRWRVYEENARVTRERCRIQAFNRFLNASELLEQFITDMAPAGIRQDQILKVPVESFINWLIYQAAAADGDPLPVQRYNHRCGYCQRFIPLSLVKMGVNFCNAQHLDRYLTRTLSNEKA